MRALAALAVLASLAPFDAAAGGSESSIRCAGGLVAVGDAKIDLLSRCGEPALVELRKEGVVEGGPGTLRDLSALSRTGLRDVEVWTYDFGPQSFVRFVVLDGGVVVRIDTGSRGYAR